MSRSPTTFEKFIRTLCDSRHLWQVFADWCEAAALTYRNAVERSEAHNARYVEILSRYAPAEAKVFGEMLGALIEDLSEEPTPDALGDLFMRLELSSHWHGQFFTPIALCGAMAEMLVADDVERLVAERGFVTVSEPTCGAGAMVIAFASAMRRRGLNPQTQLHVTAQDKDPTAARMCFVQLAALGIPALVIIGDTIRMEAREVMATPAHWLGLWPQKIRRGYALGSPADTWRVTAPAPTAPLPALPLPLPVEPVRAGQLSLFGAPAHHHPSR